MNYYPYLTDFNYLNQFSLPYSLPYGFHTPFFLPNHLSLPEFQYSSQPWRINNELIQNLKQQISQQNSKFMGRTLTQSQRQESGPINSSDKNTEVKLRAEKKVFKQKEGRNMISNLFRQALKYMLQEKDKTIQLIETISERYNMEINAKEFMEGISKKLKNFKNYVRIGQIQIFLKGKENGKSRQHAKVLRIMVNKFLRQEVIPCLCNNPKIQNSNRMIHILEKRKFCDMISLS